MKENLLDRNAERCMSAIKDSGTELNSNPKSLMQIFLLLQTYSYQVLLLLLLLLLLILLPLIIIIIFMFNILFFENPIS